MDNQLDPTVVNLTKAIRQSETGGDFNAVGDKNASHTSYGAYQFGEDTWNNTAPKYGINVPIQKATPEQQNAVAYNQIKKWKDSGKDVTQIASMWNAGEGEPNAYTGKFSNGQSSIKKNPDGTTKFDVPSYAKSVATAYQTLKQGGQVSVDASNPSSTAAPQPEQSFLEKAGSFVGDVTKKITEPVATMLARPYQLASSLVNPSQSDAQLADIPLLSKIYGPMPAPNTKEDLIKDIGRSAQTMALGIPGKGFWGPVAMGTLSGGGAGLEETGTASGGIKGAIGGAAIGTVFGGINKAFEALPTRITQSAFKGMTADEIQQTLQTKNIGTKASLLNQTQKAISTQGSAIRNILENTDSTGAGDFAVRATVQQFPEYATKTSKLISKIKTLLPSGSNGFEGIDWNRGTVAGLLDKIVTGEATLAEKNIVRSAIDSATSGGYAKLARGINPSAGYDLAMTFADALRSEVQQSVPAVQPLFSELSKEMGIRTVLEKVIKKTPSGLVSWGDIIPFMTGTTLSGGNPLVGAAATVGQRAITNPATQFAAAKTIQSVGQMAEPIISKAGLLPILLKKTNQ